MLWHWLENPTAESLYQPKRFVPALGILGVPLWNLGEGFIAFLTHPTYPSIVDLLLVRDSLLFLYFRRYSPTPYLTNIN